MAVTEAQVRAYLEPEEPNYQAAATLGPDALPILERLVQDADPLLASKAAYLASLIPDDRSNRVLERAAASPHPTVRVAAAAGLQEHPELSDDTVIDLMTDRDEGVRKVAAKARGRMTSRIRSGIAARASSEENAARKAVITSVLEHTPPPAPGDEPGSRPTTPQQEGESATGQGQGGGSIDGTRMDTAPRSSRAQAEESDWGGGGEIRGGTRDQSDSNSGTDGPDGGGQIDRATGDSRSVDPHGGGRF